MYYRWQAIMKVLLKRFPEGVALQTIYLEVRCYREETDLKVTYGQQNFKHSIRSELARLKKEGSVEKVTRGVYRLLM